MLRRELLALAASAAFVLLGIAFAAPQQAQGAALHVLTIHKADGGIERFDVELARTGEELSRGLRYRTGLPERGGMLFDLGNTRDTAFTMDDTLISLDMLFVEADGRIARIEARAPPMVTGPFPAGGPVRGVLELLGGTAERLAIRVGDRVDHPLFTAPPP